MNAAKHMILERPHQRALLVAAAVALILVWRCFDALMQPEFWAEDGTVFWKTAYDGQLAWSEPYAGYLHIIPRTIAWLTQAFPITLHPLVFAWSSIAVAAWAAYVISMQRLRYAWLLGLTVALLPYIEVLANITNIQWTTGCALLVIAIAPQISLSRHTAVFAGLASLTGPFAIFAAPVAAINALRTRTRASFLMAGIIGLGAMVQLLVLLTTDTPGGSTGETPGIVQNLLILSGGTIGRLAEGENMPRLRMVLVLVASMAFAFYREKDARFDRALAAFMFFGIWASVSLKFGSGINQLASTYSGDRYFHILAFALALYFLVTPHRRDLTIAFVAVFIAGAYQHAWKKPALDIQTWRQMAPAALTGELLAIPTNPSWWTHVPVPTLLTPPACEYFSGTLNGTVLSVSHRSGAFDNSGPGSGPRSEAGALSGFSAFPHTGHIDSFAVAYSTGASAAGQHAILFDSGGRPRYAVKLPASTDACVLTVQLPRSVSAGEIRVWDTGTGEEDWTTVNGVSVNIAPARISEPN